MRPAATACAYCGATDINLTQPDSRGKRFCTAAFDCKARATRPLCERHALTCDCPNH